jgi:hypothetical protein
MASAISAKLVRVDQLFAPAAQTATANGSSVDLKGTANPGLQEHRVHVNVGTTTGTSPTLVVKIQDSPDNSTFTDVASATTTSLTAAGVTDFYFRTANRYVRAVITIGGTTPSFTMAVDLFSFYRVV